MEKNFLKANDVLVLEAKIQVLAMIISSEYLNSAGICWMNESNIIKKITPFWYWKDCNERIWDGEKLSFTIYLHH